MKKLILASSSPRRRELIAHLQLPFVVQSADVDETPSHGELPRDLVLRLSRAKADVVARMNPNGASVVLAADTIVALDGDIIGKPRDAADAEAILKRLRGRAHQVFTGATITRTPTPNRSTSAKNAGQAVRNSTEQGKGICPLPRDEQHVAGEGWGGDSNGGSWSSVCETLVHMRNYSDDELRAYIASQSPFDKAGAYAIQDETFRPVARIVGCYLNVMGLPLCEVIRGLQALGVAVDAREPIPHET